MCDIEESAARSRARLEGSIGCAPQPPKQSGVEAANRLACLMERQLGWSDGRIDSNALRLFILAYWSRVSAYAHVIHDEVAP